MDDFGRQLGCLLNGLLWGLAFFGAVALILAGLIIAGVL